MKQWLTVLTAGMLATAVIPTTATLTNQVKTEPIFQANNNDYAFSIGTNLASVHEESYDLTYHTGISGWYEFLNNYDYFGYNGQNVLATNWYQGALLLQDQHIGTHNSTWKLSDAYSARNFNPNEGQLLEDIIFKQWSSPISWYNSACHSKLYLLAYYFNSDDGHLHFTIRLTVVNTNPWIPGYNGEGTTRWDFTPGTYASFWKNK